MAAYIAGQLIPAHALGLVEYLNCLHMYTQIRYNHTVCLLDVVVSVTIGV